MASAKTIQACQACRRLKRKCSRDLPTCSLCLRLSKSCFYPHLCQDASAYHGVGTASQTPEQLVGDNDSSNDSISSRAATCRLGRREEPLGVESRKTLPPSFFLDSDLFTPLAPGALSQCRGQYSNDIDLLQFGIDEDAVQANYFAATHDWFPMVSKRRFLNEKFQKGDGKDGCHDLLLLCMKLCAETPDKKPVDSPLYLTIKSLCFAAESGGLVSLRLIQSLILIALYELSHAIYPASYITIGRAARLAALMGLETRNYGRMLFRKADAWTLREEHRRTWWAMFIIDRCVVPDNSRVSFALDDPSVDDLLPVNDDHWEGGQIVANESVYTASLSDVTTLGHFAQLCQAAHMLGRVKRHKGMRRVTNDFEGLLEEAAQLHSTLGALYSGMSGGKEPSCLDNDSLATSKVAALSVCIAARQLLYNLYSCNETLESAARTPLKSETEMQCRSIGEIRVLSSTVVPALAKAGFRCPLTAQCLYLGAYECGWMVRDGRGPEWTETLACCTRGLYRLDEQWSLGGEYINLLGQHGLLEYIDLGT